MFKKRIIASAPFMAEWGAMARREELLTNVCGLDRFAQIQPSELWHEALVHVAALDR